MPVMCDFISLRYGSQIGMSTARTDPNFSKIRLKILSLGLTLSSFSMCRGQNQRIGKFVIWNVSGRSPGFFSSIFRASRKYESQSWRLGKVSFGSDARIRAGSEKPFNLMELPSSFVIMVFKRSFSSTSASKRHISNVLFVTWQRKCPKYNQPKIRSLFFSSNRSRILAFDLLWVQRICPVQWCCADFPLCPNLRCFCQRLLCLAFARICRFSLVAWDTSCAADTMAHNRTHFSPSVYSSCWILHRIRMYFCRFWFFFSFDLLLFENFTPA